MSSPSLLRFLRSPLLLIALGLLAFGTFIPWLGFYQDDWHHVYYFSQEGLAGLRRFLFFDSRPFAIAVYGPLFKLLGLHPLGWHLFGLLMRILVALTFLQIANLLWAHTRRENTILSALFMLYPAFLLQPMAVMFALHWAMYLLYLLSLWLMLLALRSKRYFMPLTAASLLLGAFQLLMLEYFIGLELLRPVLIFLALRADSGRKRWLSTLKTWIPYLSIAAFYVLFRLSFGALFDYDRNTPSVLLALFNQPIQTLIYLFQSGLEDFAEILVTAWYETFNPTLFDLARISVPLTWGMVLAVAALLWGGLSRLREQNDQIPAGWRRELILVGGLAVLFGLLPGWAIGKTVHTSNPLWNDRFALASLFGAAMIWVGLIHTFVGNAKSRILIFSLMLALALGAQLRSGLAYKQAWEKQTLFYWQLYWRAPQIEPGTAFVSDSEFLTYMGNYPSAFAINTLYPKQTPPGQVDFWLFTAGKNLPRWNDFREGSSLSGVKYASSFTGDSRNSLAILFEPEVQQCLWVLSPPDAAQQTLPALAYEFLPASNLARIKSAPPAWQPSPAIFGPQPGHSWCYTFQKADLARQSGDWDEIIRLWEQAAAAGFGPKHSREYMPFIEAYARTANWKTAEKLTLRAGTITEKARHPLCALWQQLRAETESTPTRAEALNAINNRLDCQP
ncbi:MAG: hypothetical protein RBS68_04760 [Anaerolineales bacterium]|jgi:hypothetical protein|nr:hypothetical protein [Anaerolineales bacterium]